ncbi:MAG: hypothetical protein KGM98_14215 [Bacteroidota bacterium]|nr:hypothetical protein [Bacteroidota bacterium]
MIRKILLIISILPSDPGIWFGQTDFTGVWGCARWPCRSPYGSMDGDIAHMAGGY